MRKHTNSGFGHFGWCLSPSSGGSVKSMGSELSRMTTQCAYSNGTLDDDDSIEPISPSCGANGFTLSDESVDPLERRKERLLRVVLDEEVPP